jgi:hypothetical protein
MERGGDHVYDEISMNYSCQLIKRIVEPILFILIMGSSIRKLARFTVAMLFIAGCSARQTPSEMAEPSSTFSVFQGNDSLSIKGTLICAHCYALNQENTGIDHNLPENGLVLDCASQCANLGYPIAVLSEKTLAGANVWVLRTSSQLFSDYMGKITEVRGSLVTKGVIEPTGILVTTAPGRKQILL